MTKEERKEYNKKYREKNKNTIAEYKKQYYQEHREEIAERQKQYFKQYYQDNKEAITEYQKQYYKEHREEIAEQRKQYFKQYYQDNKEAFAEYNKQYYLDNKDSNNQLRRASNLLGAYNQSDKQHNRGKGDLTAKWIVDNIFTKSCKCGETDWRKLGCNRLDNRKPHTMDNVEPCCGKCNKKLPRK